MFIYILSYTSYEQCDDYIYTEHTPFRSYNVAYTAFENELKTAKDSLSEDDMGDWSVIRSKNPALPMATLIRMENFRKIVIEITEHEL